MWTHVNSFKNHAHLGNVSTKHSGGQHSDIWEPTFQSQICLSAYQIVKRDSSLQSTGSARFTLLQSMFGISHSDLRHVCSCSEMATHLMKPLIHSTYNDVASRGSLKCCSEWCNRGQESFKCYKLQHLATMIWVLHGLLFRGPAVIASSNFHVTTIVFTVDQAGQKFQ